MCAERKLVKKILYLLKGLGGELPELTDIQIIYQENQIEGYQIVFKKKKKVTLKVIKGDKKNHPS